MTEAPALPTVDLRGLPYMPLYIDRLQKSKAWLSCKRRPELAFYLLNLWMRAWHELPAGSLENDDDVLCDAAMCDPRKWQSLRKDILRGWEEGPDGRLYNKTVVELGDEAFEERQQWRKRTEAAREARRQKRLAEAAERAAKTVAGNVTKPATQDATQTDTETATEPATVSVTDDATEVVTGVKRSEGEVKGKGKGYLSTGSNEPADPPSPEPPADPPDLAALFWKLKPRIAELIGKTEPTTGQLMGKWLKVGKGQALEILDEALRMRPGDPIAWIEAAVLSRQGRRGGQQARGTSITPLGVGG